MLLNLKTLQFTLIFTATSEPFKVTFHKHFIHRNLVSRCSSTLISGTAPPISMKLWKCELLDSRCEKQSLLSQYERISESHMWR